MSPELEALQMLAFVQLRQGRFDDARRLYAALHALAPNEHTCRLALAYCQLRTGQPAAALAVLSVEAADAPAGAHLLRAQALLAQGEHAAARRALERFLELDRLYPRPD
ncbi:tetratricopeptide repeat protein [uncultured Thiohalocapsa sp.]|uniref:type III secretion apparatus assembly chaperone SctY n=1 Tax=uncultured Thiohalocapsa sp. TaxID=768990 RepID=UPI0025F454EA|nr:tetratricopeptide repeat protein [uncultured Thiohalocapsa sp.]